MSRRTAEDVRAEIATLLGEATGGHGLGSGRPGADELFTALEDAPELDPIARERVLQAVLAEAAPQGTPLAWPLTIASLVAVSALLKAFGQGVPAAAPAAFAAAALLLAGAMVASIAGFWRPRSAVLGAVLVSVGVAAATAHAPGLALGALVGCLVVTVAFAVLPLVLFVAHARRAVFSVDPWVAAAVATSAGLGAQAALQVTCPGSDVALHVGLSHVGAVLLLVPLGWGVGRAARR